MGDFVPIFVPNFRLSGLTESNFPYTYNENARCRIRTCDPIRVKDVLYH